jgi:hypothetical protein
MTPELRSGIIADKLRETLGAAITLTRVGIDVGSFILVYSVCDIDLRLCHLCLSGKGGPDCRSIGPANLG